jgi:hypothetical protein
MASISGPTPMIAIHPLDVVGQDVEAHIGADRFQVRVKK